MAQPPLAVTQSKLDRRRNPAKIILLVIAVFLLLMGPTAREHIRAMSLLARMSGQRNWLTRLARREYDIETFTFTAPDGPVRARIYLPRALPHPPAMVVVHGLHQLGIDEPRLVNFAKSLAETGIEVLDPSQQFQEMLAAAAGRWALVEEIEHSRECTCLQRDSATGQRHPYYHSWQPPIQSTPIAFHLSQR